MTGGEKIKVFAKKCKKLFFLTWFRSIIKNEERWKDE